MCNELQFSHVGSQTYGPFKTQTVQCETLDGNSTISSPVPSVICPCQTMAGAADANISSAVDSICPLGNDSVQRGLHWVGNQDAKRL